MTPLSRDAGPALRHLAQYNKCVLLYYDFYIHRLSKGIYDIYTMLTVCRDAGASLRRLAGHV